MLIEEIKNIDSSCNALKKFGFTIGIFLLLVAALLFYYGKESYQLVGSGGIILMLLGYYVPKALLPLQKVWMALAVILGFFSSRFILITLYYLVLTPIGIVGRLSGKEFLRVKKAEGTSYWDKRTKDLNKKELTEKQF